MKRLIIIITIAVLLCVFISCSDKQNSVEEYVFSGENELFSIRNGNITITNEMEKISGGDITFKGEELSGVIEYNAKLYYYKNNEEIALISNYNSIEGSDNGMKIQSDLGTRSSTCLFYDNDIELIKKSLNFTLKGTFLTGEKFEYNLPLDVTDSY